MNVSVVHSVGSLTIFRSFREANAIVDSLISHRIHVKEGFLHLFDFYSNLVGKYTSPMDPMAKKNWFSFSLIIPSI